MKNGQFREKRIPLLRRGCELLGQMHAALILVFTRHSVESDNDVKVELKYGYE